MSVNVPTVLRFQPRPFARKRGLGDFQFIGQLRIALLEFNVLDGGQQLSLPDPFPFLNRNGFEHALPAGMYGDNLPGDRSVRAIPQKGVPHQVAGTRETGKKYGADKQTTLGGFGELRGTGRASQPGSRAGEHRTPAAWNLAGEHADKVETRRVAGRTRSARHRSQRLARRFYSVAALPLFPQTRRKNPLYDTRIRARASRRFRMRPERDSVGWLTKDAWTKEFPCNYSLPCSSAGRKRFSGRRNTYQQLSQEAYNRSQTAVHGAYADRAKTAGSNDISDLKRFEEFFADRCRTVCDADVPISLCRKRCFGHRRSSW